MDTSAAPHPIRVTCSACSLRELCMPAGLAHAEMLRLDAVVTERRRVPRGEALFREGERFESLFAVRSGFVKTRLAAPGGREHVMGFQTAGEILGLDGIVAQRHGCDAIALEDAEVCVMPFERMAQFSRQVPALQQHMHRVLSREIVREQGVMVLLGGMRAEERLATLLLQLVERMHARGFSSRGLVLRMSREEIGSYLGLKPETVSRTFTRLAADGLIEVHQRDLTIRDAEGLRRLANQATEETQR